LRIGFQPRLGLGTQDSDERLKCQAGGHSPAPRGLERTAPPPAGCRDGRGSRSAPAA